MSVLKYFIAGLLVTFNMLCLSGCEWFVSADQRVERAKAKAMAGEDGAALIELKKAVKSDGENIEARLFLSEVTLRLGDVRSADEELKTAEQKGAARDRVDRMRAEILLAKGEYDELLKRTEEGLQVSEADRLTFRGHALRGLNKLDEASTAYAEALKAGPDAVHAQIGLAEILASIGRSDEALAHLDAVLSQDKENALAWFARGSLLGRRGDFRLAEDALIQARRSAAGDLSSAQYNLLLVALIESQLGASKIDSARHSLNELIDRTGSTPVTHVLAARIAMTEQNYALAVAEAQKAHASAPQLMQARLILGAALMAQGNLNQAEVHLSEILKSSPENIEARKLLAQVNLRLQRPDTAAQVLAQAQQIDPNDAQLGALLGLANLQQGQSAAAIDLLEKGVAAQPNNSALKLDLATAYLRGDQALRSANLLREVPSDARNPRRDILLVSAIAASEGTAAAREEVDRFASEHAKDARSLSTAAQLHSKLGDQRRARDLLERALAIDAANTSALSALAEVALATRDFPVAHNAADKALKIEPNNSDLRILKAKIAFAAGDEGSAISLLEQVREKDRRSTNALLMLAQAYVRQRRAADADKVIDEAIQSTDMDGPVYAAAAQMYLDASRFEQGLARFRDAIKADPKNPSYYVGAARAQVALGNVDQAKESLASALAIRPNYVPAVAYAVMLDLRNGQHASASERVAALKKQSPSSPAASMLEGDVFLAGKAFERAASAYANANKLEPSAAAALREYRARALGRLPGASAPLESWLRTRPGDVAVRLVLAEDLASRGEMRAAIGHYELLARGPDRNVAALNNLAWLYNETKDRRAIETAELAYSLAPTTPAVADTLGWILLQSGEKARSVSILKTAASAGADPEIRYHYGVALAESGDRASARREFEAIVREASGSPAAAKAQEFLLRAGS